MSYLLKLSPADFCAETKACEEGRKWAVTQPTMNDVWDNCPRAEWLLWILDAINQRPDDRTMRLFAVWCARNTPLLDGRKTGDLITDPRSLAALEVAERFAHGRATLEELSAARAAARAAAREAAEDAAWAAARDAAREAAEAAARDAAREAAEDAAWAAWAAARAAWAAARDAWAAARAGAREAAEDAAWAAARAAQADHLRTLVENPFNREVNK